MNDTDQAKLNRQIATLLGWTGFETSRGDRNRLLGIAPGESMAWDVPDWTTDYGKALGLLDYMLTLEGVFRVALPAEMVGGPRRYCRIYAKMDTYVGTGDTLPLAIALAARDALNALKGDTDDGTN